MAKAIPVEHTIRFLPFDYQFVSTLAADTTAANARDATLHGPHGMRPARNRIHTPSVLSPVTSDLNNQYVYRPQAKTRVSSHPLYFACMIGGVKWTFYQGSDPLCMPETQGFVTRALQPQLVVRLNEWPADAVHADPAARLYSAYGARCAHVLYVPDLLPKHIREIDTTGHRELALALMLQQLFELLLTLIETLPLPARATGKSAQAAATKDASESSDSSDASPPNSSDVSTSDDEEMRPLASTRGASESSQSGEGGGNTNNNNNNNNNTSSSSSRSSSSRSLSTSQRHSDSQPHQVTKASSMSKTQRAQKKQNSYKHASFHRIDGPPERAVYVHCHAGKERSRFAMIALHGALYSLAARTSLSNPLAPMAALRSWVDRQACFGNNALSLHTVLTHKPDDMFPVLVGVSARLGGIGNKPEEVQKFRAIVDRAEQAGSIHGNYHNVCAAGTDCPRRDSPLMIYMCDACHTSLFCDLDCVMRSKHMTQCSTHFTVERDVPLVLRASALEPTSVYWDKQKARARAGTGSIPGGTSAPLAKSQPGTMSRSIVVVGGGGGGSSNSTQGKDRT